MWMLTSILGIHLHRMFERLNLELQNQKVLTFTCVQASLQPKSQQ